MGVFAPTVPFKTNPVDSTFFSEYGFASRTNTSPANYNNMYADILTSLSNANFTGVRSHRTEHWNYMASARLLAAQVKIRYIGRDDSASGIISVGTFVGASPNQATAFTDNSIQELKNPCRVLPKEGAVVTWYPLDETDREFQAVDQAKTDRGSNLAFAF